jgi:uncharacterized protein YdaL
MDIEKQRQYKLLAKRVWEFTDWCTSNDIGNWGESSLTAAKRHIIKLQKENEELKRKLEINNGKGNTTQPKMT